MGVATNMLARDGPPGDVSATLTEAYLLTVETGGNQHYIFATNKVREIVGASQLTHESTTDWLDEALRQTRARRGLGEPAAGARIESGPDIHYELLQRTSGKAFVLFRQLDVGKEVLSRISLRALVEAPGLEFFGEVVAAPLPAAGVSGREMVDAVERANRGAEASRAALGAEARNLRVPIVEDCSTSSLPAEAEAREPGPGGRWQARSSAVLVKRRALPRAQRRLGGQIPSIDRLERLFEAGEQSLSWVAVVHADGNGIGQLLQNLSRAGSARDYLSRVAKFSGALDAAGRGAYERAAAEVPDVNGVKPIIPIIIGGDDLTVVVPGRHALRFTRRYLEAFDYLTGKGILAKLAPAGRLSASAGIAAVKPHYPFSSAYVLAEELADSAKRVKREVDEPASALDFHLLYDRGTSSLGALRDLLRVDADRTRLFCRPYVVTGVSGASGWAATHAIATLDARVEKLKASDPDDPTRRAISRSQISSVRATLRDGVRVATARANIVGRRHPAFSGLFDGAHTLFADDGNEQYTRLLDAMDVVELESS